MIQCPKCNAVGWHVRNCPLRDNATFFPESDPVAEGARRANDLLDPRKRALAAVRNMPADWYCPFDGERQRIDCPECVAQVALDAYEAVQRLDHGITT